MPSDEKLGPACSNDHCSRNKDCADGECIVALLARIAELEAALERCAEEEAAQNRRSEWLEAKVEQLERYKRFYWLEKEIAEYPVWGAALTAMNEERNSLRRSLNAEINASKEETDE